MSKLISQRVAALAALGFLLFTSGNLPAFAACQTTTQFVAAGTTFTNTGCISTTNINGVSAGPGSTVTNSTTGSITLTTSAFGPNPAAIFATGNSTTITNNGAIAVNSSNFIAGVGIAAAGASNIINNNGTMVIDSGYAGIFSGVSGSATNNGTITLLRQSGFAIIGPADVLMNNNSLILAGTSGAGLLASPAFPQSGVTTMVTNNGTISDLAGGTSNIGMVCIFQCALTNSASGRIILRGPSSTGMLANGGSLTLTNNGAVTMSGSGATAITSLGPSNTIGNNGPIIVSGDSSTGIAIFDGNNTSANPGTVSKITNSSTIQATGAGSIAVNFTTLVLPDAIIQRNGQPSGASGNQFTNAGTITAGRGAIAIGDMAVVHGLENAHPTNNIVFNPGTIDGQIALAQGTDESLMNSGTMTISYAGAGITHSINGTFTQTSSGSLGLRIDPTGANDRVAVTGVANIAGNVQVNAQPGSYAPNAHYTLLAATGGINGRFGSLSTNMPSMAFLRPALSYDPNDVFLTMSPTNPTAVGTVDYRAAAQNYNQLRLAGGLTFAGMSNPGGTGGTIMTALNSLGPGQPAGVFDTLSGAGIAATQNIALDGSKLFTSAMNDQGRYWREGGPDMNGITISDAPSFYASTKKGPFDVAPPPPPPALQRTWRAWFTGFGQGERVNGELPLGTARQDNGLYGGAGGLDYQLVPNTLIGVAAGGSSGRFSVPTLATSGTVDGGHIGIYGVTTLWPFYAQSSSTFSLFRNHETRNIGPFGGLPGETERGDFASKQMRSRLEIGRKFIWSDFAMTPFVAMEIAKLWSNAFTETGGILGLTTSARSQVSAPAFAGARFEKAFVFGNGWVFTPSLSAAWVHEFSPVRDLFVGLTFLAASSFVVDGARPASNAAQVKAGAKLAVNQWAAVYADFEGEFSNKSQTYAGKGGVKVSW